MYLPSAIDPPHRIEHFFKKISAWAVEQIRCIYNFLYWYVSADFYAKCEHDVQLVDVFVLPSENEDTTVVYPRREPTLDLAYVAM